MLITHVGFYFYLFLVASHRPQPDLCPKGKRSRVLWTRGSARGGGGRSRSGRGCGHRNHDFGTILRKSGRGHWNHCERDFGWREGAGAGGVRLSGLGGGGGGDDYNGDSFDQPPTRSTWGHPRPRLLHVHAVWNGVEKDHPWAEGESFYFVLLRPEYLFSW